MKIVLAPDSFKGSATAPEAVAAMAAGIRRACPDAEIIEKPMADGGDGTAEAIRSALDGKWMVRTVCGPLPDQHVQAGFVWIDSMKSALVEMATASGLILTPVPLRNPLNTTTFGTGELIKAAADYGAERIWLAVGGSATVDGGVGAAKALGWRFLDEENREVPLGGKGLSLIVRIEPPPVRISATVEVLCDVTNPLLGERGAPKVFGPQKGATPEMVEELERGLANLAARTKAILGVDIATLACGGAAGGLSAGAVAFMSARLTSGASTVADAIGLSDALADADWVITGEGSFDHQSLGGKVISGVATAAASHGVKIGVIAGRVQIESQALAKAGITAALSSTPEGMPVDTAMQQARDLIGQAAEAFARKYLM